MFSIKMNKLYTYIFSMAYISMFIPKFMNLNYGVSEWSFIYPTIRNFFLPMTLCVLLTMLFRETKKHEVYRVVVFAAFSVFFAFLSKDFFIALFFIFLLFSKPVDFNVFLKILFSVFLLLVLIYILNFIIFYFFLDNAGFILDGKFGVRHTFELYHPNAFPIRMFIFFSLYILIRKKLYLLEVIFLLAINVFVFYFSHSRTAFYMAMFLLIFSYFQQCFNIVNMKYFRVLSKMSVLLLFVVWFLLAYMYRQYPDTFIWLNDILSGRVDISSRSLYDLGIGFIPKDIKTYMAAKKFSIDVMYIYSLLSYGLLFVFVFSYFFFKLLDLLYSYGLYKEVFVILSLIVYSCFERSLLDISLNYPLIFFSFLLYKSNLIEYIDRRKTA